MGHDENPDLTHIDLEPYAWIVWVGLVAAFGERTPATAHRFSFT